jgi:hypothetical protein
VLVKQPSPATRRRRVCMHAAAAAMESIRAKAGEYWDMDSR